ncbi:hypothetical protein CEW89_08395 [Celeribacter ethanolicus]|uniref:Uncharacterized protein n=1 Tax=Celeribacter ethanolicus TaxID=1758178 RepID=A0A291GC39_9RHOB|nr:hypothetical protein [Celeribacter ethanolicus]ATG47592.1 hypothetical protein CEW89_08395 [Celeribacter ethanolicus]
MTAYWPISIPQCAMYDGVSGGPQDVRATFEPAVGDAISRPRMTGAVSVYQISLPAMELAEFEVFDDWFAEQTGRGSTAFVWRDPVRGNPRSAKFSPGEVYAVQRRGKWRFVTLKLSFLPGSLWYAGYIPSGVSIPPVMIADFANDLYGTDTGSMATAVLSDLFALTGDPVDDETGLTLDEDDGAVMVFGDWMPEAGTLVVTLSGAAAGGDGVAVVSFDASDALVYVAGALAATLDRAAMPYLTFEEAETVVSVLIYPERLPAQKCAAMATGDLVFQ